MLLLGGLAIQKANPKLFVCQNVFFFPEVTKVRVPELWLHCSWHVVFSFYLVVWFCSFLLGVCNKQSVFFRKSIPRVEMLGVF